MSWYYKQTGVFSYRMDNAGGFIHGLWKAIDQVEDKSQVVVLERDKIPTLYRSLLQ